MTTEVIKDGDTIVERNILRWRGFTKVADGSIGIINVATRIKDIISLMPGDYLFNIGSAEEVGWEMVLFKVAVFTVVQAQSAWSTQPCVAIGHELYSRDEPTDDT